MFAFFFVFPNSGEFYVYHHRRNFTMTTTFHPRKTYSFDVYPSAILGTGFKNVTVSAILDYQAASAFSDLEAIHLNVYPYLPPNTPNRPQDFDYLMLRTDSGDSTIIGIPWIIDETIELIQMLKINVVIDGVGSADLDRIRACLSQNGYDKISLTLVGNSVPT